MEEKLVSFGIAQLAKQKGFDKKCFYTYSPATRKSYFNSVSVNPDNEQYYVISESDIIKNDTLNGWFLAPTQSFLKDWLREVHNIHIYVEPSWNINNIGIKEARPLYCPWVIGTSIDIDEDPPVFFKTHEEAMEVILVEALNLIK